MQTQETGIEFADGSLRFSGLDKVALGCVEKPSLDCNGLTGSWIPHFTTVTSTSDFLPNKLLACMHLDRV